MIENEYIVFFILLSVFNIFLISSHVIISKIYNLFDKPDEDRKSHISPVPLIGGAIILINLIFFFIFEFFIINKVHLSETLYLNEYFLDSKKKIFSFAFTLTFIFALGYFDDKYNLDPFRKLIILSIIFYIFFSFDDTLILKYLNLSFVGYQIQIINIGFFLTIFCCLFFINALNMYDGINGQLALISFNIFTFFLLNNFMPMFSFLMMLSLVSFLFLNLRGKIFLGDNGGYILSFIIIYFLITYYQKGLINLDEIFIIFILPILDAIRLFITRILVSGQPWKADANHIHHLIIRKYNFKIALFSQYFFSTFLIILIAYSDINNLLTIFLAVSLYFICIFKLINK